MGGYGAFKIAMTNPDNYEAAVSFSGPMNISAVYAVLGDDRIPYKGEPWEKHKKQYGEIAEDIINKNNIDIDVFRALFEQGNRSDSRIFRAIFGENPCLKGNEHDIFFLAEKLKTLNKRLRLYALCGTSDLHYKSNLLFRKFAENLELDYIFEDCTSVHYNP